MATTTVISARVNPACKAQTSLDLYLAFTVFSALPRCDVRAKNHSAFEQLSLGHCTCTLANSDVARSESALLEVTNVSELLCSDILPQPLQASAKIPSKSKNIKQLYLFARNAKIFKDLHFRTRAKRGTGAVALW
ncbi:MAG TPA: hypothetical protein VH024_08510, partial [Candidatus Angelobacter sp.]|nr:hypothetical protein [Candidatus Angelobacter sp.]